MEKEFGKQDLSILLGPLRTVWLFRYIRISTQGTESGVFYCFFLITSSKRLIDILYSKTSPFKWPKRRLKNSINCHSLHFFACKIIMQNKQKYTARNKICDGSRELCFKGEKNHDWDLNWRIWADSSVENIVYLFLPLPIPAKYDCRKGPQKQKFLDGRYLPKKPWLIENT